MYANMKTMERTLGQEIRHLRSEAGLTLREFAKALEISAAYQSDIEHDRRRPPEPLLREMAQKLRGVGATYEGLEKMDMRLDHETKAWANATPGVREMLRRIRESGQDPREVLKALETEAKRGKR